MAYTILVVEDDEELRPMLVSVLEDEDYEVVEAHSGERALELARSTFFDLIISDIRMEGMDGLEAAEAIHRIQPDVPLIVVTGYALDDAPIRAVRQEAIDYLHKPFQLRELLRVVEEALNQQAIQDNVAKLTAALQQADADNSDRARVFRKFFVAVRSGRLDKLEAFQVWEKLQDADNSGPKRREDYSEVEDFLEAATSKWMVPSEIVPITQDFEHFFEQIKDGYVSRHEMVIAPLLRGLTKENLAAGAPHLVDMRQKLWG